MEVGILRRLRHPNIIRLVDFFEEPMTFYVVTELAAGRGLFDTVVRIYRYTIHHSCCVYLSCVIYVLHVHVQYR